MSLKFGSSSSELAPCEGFISDSGSLRHIERIFYKKGYVKHNRRSSVIFNKNRLDLKIIFFYLGSVIVGKS